MSYSNSSSSFGRDYNAYLTPSGIMEGISLNLLMASYLILFSKYANNLAWNLSLFTTIAVTCFVGMQIIILDYFSSPYNSSAIGLYLISVYGLNLLCTVFIALLMIYRIKIIYDSKIVIWLISAMGILVSVVKGFGNFYGIFVSYHFYIGNIQNPTQDPDYINIAKTMAVAESIEAAFLVLCSLMFLFALFFDGDWRDYIKLPKVWQVLLRIGAIFLINIIIVTFAVWIVYSDNYISHNGFFLTSIQYSLQIYEYLDLSFVSSKEILFSKPSSLSTRNDQSIRFASQNGNGNSSYEYKKNSNLKILA